MYLAVLLDVRLVRLGRARGSPRRPLIYRLTQSLTPCTELCSESTKRDHGFDSTKSRAATAIARPTWNKRHILGSIIRHFRFGITFFLDIGSVYFGNIMYSKKYFFNVMSVFRPFPKDGHQGGNHILEWQRNCLMYVLRPSQNICAQNYLHLQNGIGCTSEGIQLVEVGLNDHHHCTQEEHSWPYVQYCSYIPRYSCWGSTKLSTNKSSDTVGNILLVGI